MGLIFISHSSHDNNQAKAMHDWLATHGWDDVFIDLDPVAGLAPGQRWRDELRKAGENCSAVIVIISPHWAASKWCLTEFLLAEQLGKEIFPVLIAPCSLNELPGELHGTYEFVDISTPEKLAEGYERLRIGLQRAGLHPGAFRWPPENEPDRPPFRGLRMLEEPDAAIFFGRDTHITKALDAIRRLRQGAPERMLVILGASGTGKSSFLRAGLLARLKRDTERFVVLKTLRPGMAPLTGPTGLLRSLDLGGPLNSVSIARRFEDLRASVIEHPGNYAPLPKDGARVESIPPTVILPIDQAEELYVAGDEEAATVVAAIVEILKAEPNLLLLLTIRTDSYALLQGNPLLSGIPRMPFDLPRLPAAALKEIIAGPTRLPSVGIAIDPDLTEQLIEDFEGGDAMPLLAFTLERLIADHCTNGRLSKHTYLENMKGVGGAIRKAVEIAFAKAAEHPNLPKTREELNQLAQRTIVPGLVRIDDFTAEPRRRVALRRMMSQEALPLIDQFVDQRLLVADTQGREPTIEVSHEAILRHWQELASWIAVRREDLILSERVTAAAYDWQVADFTTKTEALVHRGERLRDAEKLLYWDDLGWTKDSSQVAYLAACREAEIQLQATQLAQEKREKRIAWLICGLFGVICFVIIFFGGLLINGLRNQSRTQSLALARAAERFAGEGDYLRSLRLSILATQANLLQPTTSKALVALSSNAQMLKLTLEIRGHEGTVFGAVLSKDESRILTWSSDKTVRLWDIATGEMIGQPLKHEGGVSSAVFSKDENRILTSSSDKTARLWETATGEMIGQPLKHEDVVSGTVFSEDESRILTWSSDKTVRLWDATSGKPIGRPLKHEDAVSGAIFSKDESRILTSSFDKTVRLWDVATGEMIGQPFKHEDVVSGAVFSKDESRVLTWSFDKTVRLWDATTGEMIGQPLKHEGGVSSAVFSKDESRILTSSFDKTARLWDAATGEMIGQPLKHEGGVSSAVFSKDESRILTSSFDKTARLWNAATGEMVSQSFKHDNSVFGAVFLKDESRILTWSSDKTARLWETATREMIGQPLKHEDVVSGTVFSEDESRILTWSSDKTVRLWDATTGKLIGRPLKHEDAVSGAVFSDDESRILTWSFDKTVRLWDVATGEMIGQPLKHEGGVSSAVFSKDESRILTSSSDKTARLWETATGEMIGQPLRHEDVVSGAVFSKDESRILTWSFDKTVRLWDVATGEMIGQPFKHEDIVSGAVFSKDEKCILTWGADKTVRLWDVATGEMIGQPFKHEDVVSGAVFSKDESRVLTWSFDKTVRLWDVATGEMIGQPLKHEGGVSSAVFSKDESRILTSSSDKTARLWETATGEMIGQPLKHEDVVSGAVFSKDEKCILTWGADKTARLWDVQWAMRDTKDTNFVRDLCREKLVGASVKVRSSLSGSIITVGVRHIDAIDTAAALILHGREGEDVCYPPPTAMETLVRQTEVLRSPKELLELLERIP